MIQLTKVNFRQEIKNAGLAKEAEAVLIGSVSAVVNGFIPPIVDSKQKFDRIKAEVGLIRIDGEDLELVKQAMTDNQSFRVRVKPIEQ